jgi:hypothetical protein
MLPMFGLPDKRSSAVRIVALLKLAVLCDIEHAFIGGGGVICGTEHAFIGSGGVMCGIEHAFIGSGGFMCGIEHTFIGGGGFVYYLSWLYCRWW